MTSIKQTISNPAITTTQQDAKKVIQQKVNSFAKNEQTSRDSFTQNASLNVSTPLINHGTKLDKPNVRANNQTSKIDYNGTLLDDKAQYKLSEIDPHHRTFDAYKWTKLLTGINPDLLDKTILKENIRPKDINITFAYALRMSLKDNDCILGALNISNVDLKNLSKLSKLSYVRDGINITTKSGDKLFISKDLGYLRVTDAILNSPQGKDVRDFASKNNLPILNENDEWVLEHGEILKPQ